MEKRKNTEIESSDRNAKRQKTDRATAEKTVKKLLDPKPISDLVTAYEDSEPFVISRSNPKYYEGMLPSVDALKAELQKKGDTLLYEGVDVYSYKSGKKNKLQTKDDPIKQSDLWSSVEEGWCVDILNGEAFSSEFRDLIDAFDAFWPGEGGVQGYFTLTHGKIPPHASGEDRLILQISGTLSIQVYQCFDKNPDADFDTIEYQEYYPYQIPNIFLKTQKKVISTELKPGDLLYLPASVPILSTAGVDLSLFATIMFPRPSSWVTLLNKVLSTARLELKIEDSPRLVSNLINQDEDNFSKVTESMLRKALDILPNEAAQHHKRKELKKRDYYVPDEWIKSKLNNEKDLATLLEKNDGFIKIRNFLPEHVANNLLTTVQYLTEEEWELSEAIDMIYTNDTEHKFLIGSSFPNSTYVYNIFRKLNPGKNIFSVAQYNKDHYLAEHTDKGRITFYDTEYYRKIAIIYYLTKDWKDTDGGYFVDRKNADKDDQENKPENMHIPEWNTLIAFTVPRRHLVTPILSDKPRYSVFGWFLDSKKLYSSESGGSKSSDDEDDEDKSSEGEDDEE